MSYEHLPHNHGQAMEQQGCLMPETADFQIVSDIFKQLGDSSRVRIFWILCHCAECVTDLGAMVGMSAAAVSHHLQVLRRAGLVVSSRQGKEIHYTLADTHEARLLHRAVDALFEVACP